ncbi:hypothetical protein F5Y05DRAFT_374980 [Hypoxylon sp. FL0543]|nr:hypothetical protein F5Y05DRAFT_374980 [Hypoxylon sp. FL0543]
MQLTSIIAAAGLAASTTNALLLPPEVSESDNNLVTTLPVPLSAVYPDVSRTLKLKCPGCPVRIPHHKKVKVVNDVPSHLELNFSVEAAGAADRLMLNGFELYPKADPLRNSLSAVVRPDVPHRRTKRPHYKGPQSEAAQNLGFGMQTRTIPSLDEKDSLELVMINLDIIEVGDVFVDGVPDVQIKLMKTPTGQLIIGDIDVTESDTKQNPMENQEECTTFICKWKAIVAQKLASLRLHKGCGGHRAHAPSHDQAKEDSQISQPDSTSPVDGDNGRHHGHRQRNWGLLFRNIASHILLPVAIGILAGVAASILGMMVGTFVVFLWRLVFRRGGSRRHHRHGHHHKASHAEAVAHDEKAGLMAHVEEDEVAPPAYVEEGVVVLDDKKTENVA